MKIQVLGSGCPTCKTLYKNVQDVVAKIGMDTEVEYSTDIGEIVKLGAMSSPVFAIDGKIVAAGKVPNNDEIESALLKANKIPDLRIVWRRLVIENGETCPRCHVTETSVERAVKKLSEILVSVEKIIELKKIEIIKSDFEKNPLKSNEITINEKTLEDWLGATAGKSQCCEVCADNECRTLEFEGIIYEEIPEDLIVRAGLIAVEYKPSNDYCNCSCGGNC